MNRPLGECGFEPEKIGNHGHAVVSVTEREHDAETTARLKRRLEGVCKSPVENPRDIPDLPDDADGTSEVSFRLLHPHKDTGPFAGFENPVIDKALYRAVDRGTSRIQQTAERRLCRNPVAFLQVLIPDITDDRLFCKLCAFPLIVTEIHRFSL